MSTDYFSQTKEHHQKAVNRLATGDEDDLIYACLELRKCIEAYCYNLLSSYLSEAPFRAVETWQPDKVLKELLAIDSGFENTSAFRMQVDDGSGKLGEWMSLGEDRRLPISYVRSSYQALGNFLHVPTIKQVNSGSSVQAEKIREKAAAISERLAAVLAPGRIVSNIGQFCTFNCSQCEAPIARRMPFLDAGGEVECGNCGQQYDYERTTDGRIKFVARAYSWECANCKTPRQVPQSQAKEGLDVSCPECSHPANLRFTARWTVDTVREENN